MLKKDGHTHTRFSHHGSNEPLSSYIERAIELGFKEYVVTEHAPLPKSFLTSFHQPRSACFDSALKFDELDDYKEEVEEAQNNYKKYINIKRGFEVDYFDRFESETASFLRFNQDWFDEIILSVHFLPTKSGELAAIDYDVDTFKKYFGEEVNNDPQALFKRYFETIRSSIIFASKLGSKVRIGHLTLIRIYQHYFNLPDFDKNNQQLIKEILLLIKENNYQLDYNSAGYRKTYNGDSYPTDSIVKEALALNIPLVYGSDAHEVKQVGLYFAKMDQFLKNNG